MSRFVSEVKFDFERNSALQKAGFNTSSQVLEHSLSTRLGFYELVDQVRADFYHAGCCKSADNAVDYVTVIPEKIYALMNAFPDRKVVLNPLLSKFEQNFEDAPQPRRCDASLNICR